MTEHFTLPDDEMTALIAALGDEAAGDIAKYFHPLANIFPLMLGAAGDDLGASMEANGQREQCVMLDGLLLDGRNRAIQARRRGLTLRMRPFDPERDGNPLQFVLDLNLHRRQLTTGQRAMAAARLETLGHGGARASKQDANLHLASDDVDRAEAAERLKVAPRSVASAVVVQRDAIEPVQAAVDAGTLPVSAAETLAGLPKERQEEIVLTLPRDAQGNLTADARKQLGPLIKEVREVKQREKKEKRSQREVELAQKIRALPEQKFGLVLSDYEWDHEPYSRETGMDRHPGNHYPTSADAHTPEEIAARLAERMSCAAEDCVWIGWTTIPHLAIALRVVELMGFTYKSHIVWNKVRPGMGRGPGYWVTGEHELLLICTRGKVVAPDTAHFRSSFEAPVGEHSEKPDFQYEFAEYHFPNLPKIELNARRARPGWHAWGFDAPDQEAVPIASQIEFLPLDEACCARDGWPEGVCLIPDSFQLTPELIAELKQPAHIIHLQPGDDGGIPAFLRRAQ